MRYHWIIWLCLPIAPLCASPAAARDAGDITLSVAPLYAYVVFSRSDEPDGAGASLALDYAVSDGVALGLAASWTGHGVEEQDERPGGTLQIASLGFSAGYALDLDRFSPTLEGAVGILHRRLAGESATDLGFRVGLAFDYWLVDWLALGVAGHYHAFLTDPQTIPVYVDLGLRLVFRWRAGRSRSRSRLPGTAGRDNEGAGLEQALR